MQQITIGVLGATGQQGSRTTNLLGDLCIKDRKYGDRVQEIHLVDVRSTNERTKVSLDNLSEKLRASGLSVRTYAMNSTEYISEYGPEVVFDATNTSYQGMDNHALNIIAHVEKHGTKLKAIGLEDVPPLTAVGVEKPLTQDGETATYVVAAIKKLGIPLTVHAVESYMDVKKKTLQHIAELSARPSAIAMYRLSSVQSKMLSGGRDILVNNGGTIIDKLPHDANYLFEILRAAHGEPELPTIDSVHADILELNTPNGPVYIRNDGTFTDAGQRFFNTMIAKHPNTADFWTREKNKTMDVHLPNLNEVYVEANMHANGVPIKMVASQTHLKDMHVTEIDRELNDQIKQGVSDAAQTRLNIPLEARQILPAYGVNRVDAETRTTVIHHDDGGKHLLQTYFSDPNAKFNPAPFYSVYQSPTGEVEVVHIGWNNGHLEWIKNTLDSAFKTGTPQTHIDDVWLEVHTLNLIRQQADRNGRDTIDLTQDSTLRTAFEGPITEAKLW